MYTWVVMSLVFVPRKISYHMNYLYRKQALVKKEISWRLKYKRGPYP